MTAVVAAGPTSRVLADATLVAEAVGGATRLARVRDAPPLVFRRTAPGHVHLIGAGGGPVAGDQLHLRIEVGAEASLTVHHVAASVALPAPNATGPSRLDIEVLIGRGASLVWWGKPLVAAAGCDHETALQVDLDDDATLVWREETVLGRQGEAGGRVRNLVALRRHGRTLLRSDASVGGPDWDSPAVGGGARGSGTMLAVGPVARRLEDPCSSSAARLQVADDVVVVTALAADHRRLRSHLDAAARPLCAARSAD